MAQYLVAREFNAPKPRLHLSVHAQRKGAHVHSGLFHQLPKYPFLRLSSAVLVAAETGPELPVG